MSSTVTIVETVTEVVTVDEENVVVAETSTTETVELGIMGPQGPPGESAVSGVVAFIQHTGAAPIGGHRLVSPQADGTLELADPTDLAEIHRPVWLTTQAAGADEDTTVVSFGPVTEPSWAWTPGAPLYLAANGLLTHTVPTAPGSAFLKAVASAVTPTTIQYDPQPPIQLI